MWGNVEQNMYEETFVLFILNPENKLRQEFLNGSAGFVFKKAYNVAEKKGWETKKLSSGEIKAFAVPEEYGVIIQTLISYACMCYYPDIEDKAELYDNVDVYFISDEEKMREVIDNLEDF